MNRTELRWLARERIRDAKSLLLAHRWSGAYYLAGYAVECGLKACIIASLQKTDKFPERKFSEQCWSHNLAQLVELAGLKPMLGARMAADSDFFSNWEFVKDWTEVSRYSRNTAKAARKLYIAITDQKAGVLPWIRTYL